MKTYSDELTLDFKSYDQLTYEDNRSTVTIFLDNIPMGLCRVFTDRNNEEREYVCINYEIVYLDTLKEK